MQVAVASYCLPTIAIGGVMLLALTGDQPRVVLAALSCFFTTLVGMHVGLKSVDQASLDLVRAYGGGSWTQLVKVRLRTSLPSLFAGLRIAAPAAMLGTIIGEWLGAENGLGVAMVNSQQALQIERTWGLALTITAISALAYAITALVARLAHPLGAEVGPMTAVTQQPTVVVANDTGGFRGGTASRLLQVALNAVIGIVSISVVWEVLIQLADLTDFNRRGPLDIWRYLTAADSGPARSILWDATMTTVRDAGLGLFAGTIAGLAVALAFNRWPVFEQGSMPVAMALRSVPLVAMTPLIILVFDRGLVGVTVISGIVTFFPTLVNVALALRSVPSSSVDLMSAYGSTRSRTLLRVQLPYSLPALFASIRIAAPLAVIGAYLAEYLATGQGLGYLMLTANFASDYDQMWAAVAIITFGAVLLYQIISAIEQVVLTRFAADPNAR